MTVRVSSTLRAGVERARAGEQVEGGEQAARLQAQGGAVPELNVTIIHWRKGSSYARLLSRARPRRSRHTPAFIMASAGWGYHAARVAAGGGRHRVCRGNIYTVCAGEAGVGHGVQEVRQSGAAVAEGQERGGQVVRCRGVGAGS